MRGSYQEASVWTQSTGLGMGHGSFLPGKGSTTRNWSLCWSISVTELWITESDRQTQRLVDDMSMPSITASIP